MPPMRERAGWPTIEELVRRPEGGKIRLLKQATRRHIQGCKGAREYVKPWPRRTGIPPAPHSHSGLFQRAASPLRIVVLTAVA